MSSFMATESEVRGLLDHAFPDAHGDVQVVEGTRVVLDPGANLRMVRLEDGAVLPLAYERLAPRYMVCRIPEGIALVVLQDGDVVAYVRSEDSDRLYDL